MSRLVVHTSDYITPGSQWLRLTAAMGQVQEIAVELDKCSKKPKKINSHPRKYAIRHFQSFKLALEFIFPDKCAP